MKAILFLAALAPACGGGSSATQPQPRPAPLAAATPIALPGAPADGVFLDYLAYDADHHNVWVPAGGTGKVAVIDATTRKLTSIDGFPTQEIERRGQKRLVGPTSVTIGKNVAFVGNRGDSTVCAFDAATLAKRGCITLDSMPDGLQYVPATNEVWVTTPRDQSIRILDVSARAPVLKDTIKFEGDPEGFAVDNTRGVFFTNLEDKDKTLAVDIKTHAITSTWEPHCGEDGPKGLVFVADANQLVVVCPAKIETLDVAHGGAVLGSLDVGDGLDAIDYVPGRHELFAAAARAEKMVVARLAADGKMTPIATITTAKGARNAVATEDGTAYVADGPAGAVIVVPPVTR
jgi:DNA-binding beta-propeller fold protein YncE